MIHSIHAQLLGWGLCMEIGFDTNFKRWWYTGLDGERRSEWQGGTWRENPRRMRSWAQTQQAVGIEVKVMIVCYELEISIHSCSTVCVCHNGEVWRALSIMSVCLWRCGRTCVQSCVCVIGLAFPKEADDLNDIRGLVYKCTKICVLKHGARSNLEKISRCMKPSTFPVPNLWPKIPKDYCEKLIDGYPKQPAEVMKVNGSATKY